MQYELKSIFRSKVTLICMFICIILGLQTFIQMEVDYQASLVDKDSNMLRYEQNVAFYQEQIEANESQWDYYLNSVYRTKAQQAVFLAEHEYLKWLRNAWQECYDYIDNFGYDRQEVWKLEARIAIISGLCDMSTFSYEKEGYPPATVVFAEELERNQESLRLDELTFSVDAFANSPFMTDDDRKHSITEYLSRKNYVEMWLDAWECPEHLNGNSASPYTFWARFFSFYEHQGIIIGSIVIMFSAFYMTECKKNGSRQLLELAPYSAVQKAGYYYKAILAAIICIMCCAVGIPTLLAAILHGFGGLETIMWVDYGNFEGWIPYEHGEGYSTVFLGKVYFDYIENGETLPLIVTEKAKITLGQFLLPASILGTIKLLWFTLLGFTIGYLGRNRGRTLLVAVLITGGYIVSQYTDIGMKWNPLAVKNAWDVTSGGTNVTWLNAVVVILVGIGILLGAYVFLGRKKDYC